jgi:cytidine deaminase
VKVPGAKPAMKTDATVDALMSRAQDVRGRAYAPYSNFSVGAALETDSGEIFCGANVENASYGLSICAERSAVAAAVSAGHRHFRAIAVAGPPDAVAVPCGACRQVLSEFNGELIVAHTTPQGVAITTLDRLLPAAFRT